MMDIALFVYYCRSIARLKGKLKQIHVWPCSSWPNPVVYEDAHLKIIGDFKSLALYVEMLLPHQNPVICIDEDGTIYRLHGERHMIEDRIKKLAILEKPTTPEEKVQFLLHWGDWFYEHTNTFNGAMGRSLAYLYMAVLKDHTIEVSVNSALVQLLKRNSVPDFDPVWNYIDIVGVVK